MNLPKRIKQHKAESDSYAILLYKLKDLGIFRNLTGNDYGIDFEIEIVTDGAVTGKYVKAQVKSSEKLKIRRSDNVPVVGGIKESTLYYWTELSYKTNVLAYAVDLTTEKIFITKPIFWQATKLINGSGKTKSIEFIAIKKDHAAIVAGLTYAWALAPNISDIIYYHQFLLRHLEMFINLYVDVFHYDYDSSLQEPENFRLFLELAQNVSWNVQRKKFDLTKEEKKNLFSYHYWAVQGKEGNDIPNYICQKPMKVLMPIIMDFLKQHKKLVLEGKYYWRHKNLSYLRLVYETDILDEFDTHQSIMDYGYSVRGNGIGRLRDFSTFVAEIDYSHKGA